MAYIWLSHILNENTPQYAGVNNLKIEAIKSQSKGDSCNESQLVLPAHAGTHVDSPFHFVNEGKCIEQYSPEEWIFNHIAVLYITSSSDRIIDADDLNLHELQEELSEKINLVLIKTGFEKYRHKKKYWSENPILSVESAKMLINHFPELKAVGIDSISFSNINCRDIGREVHKQFLQRGIRLFEDMSLKLITKETPLKKIIALPLRFQNSDGSPCSIIGIS